MIFAIDLSIAVEIYLSATEGLNGGSGIHYSLKI